MDVAHGIQRVGLAGAQRLVAAQGAHGGIRIAGLCRRVPDGVEQRDVFRLQFRRPPVSFLRRAVLVAIHQRIAQRAPCAGIAAVQRDQLGQGSLPRLGVAAQLGGFQFQAGALHFGDGLAQRQGLVQRG